MKKYFEQDGCHSCKSVFKREDFGESETYYCTCGVDKRPLCMSDLMNECPELKNMYDKEFDLAEEQWQKWAKKYIVKAYGKCDMYENKNL